jgi:hypothetical protein
MTWRAASHDPNPGPYAVVEAHGDSLDFVGYGRGADSRIFTGQAEDAEPPTEPLRRSLPLAARQPAAAAAGKATAAL